MKVILANTETMQHIKSLTEEMARLREESLQKALTEAKFFCAIQDYFMKHGSMTHQDYTRIYLREVKGIGA